MNQNKSTIVIIALIALALVTRILNHNFGWIANFSPIAAIGLFGAVNFKNKWMAILIPASIMLVTDFIIGTHKYMPFVYGSFLIISFIGFALKNRFSATSLLTASLLSSVVFFVVTNFGVWALGGYSYTIGGFTQCYVEAIPFFKNTLAGDLFYTGVLFGAFELVKKYQPALLSKV